MKKRTLKLHTSNLITNACARCCHFILIFALSAIWQIYQPSDTHADSGISYIVSIKGVNDREFLKLIESVSNTFSLKKKPPVSINHLERRLSRDIPRMLKVLRSKGFYIAEIAYEINTDQAPVRVSFLIEPGPLYLLDKIKIHVHGEGSALKDELPPMGDLGLASRSSAGSKIILDARDKLRHWFRTKGYPFVKIEYPSVIVDHSVRGVSVDYFIDTGPVGKFGISHIEGLEFVKKKFVIEKLPWKAGDPFNEDLLEEAKKALYKTGLFSSINIEVSENLDENNEIILYIKVRERSRRTFKAGVNYMTDEGPGARLSWENRNLSGQGELLGGLRAYF